MLKMAPLRINPQKLPPVAVNEGVFYQLRPSNGLIIMTYNSVVLVYFKALRKTFKLGKVTLLS